MHEWTGCGGGWMSMAGLPFCNLDARPLGAFAACQRQRLCSLPAPAPLPDLSSLRSQHSPGRPALRFIHSSDLQSPPRASQRSLVAAAGSPTTHSFVHSLCPKGKGRG